MKVSRKEKIMAEKFICPKCGSDNIQSCQVIYQNGTVGHSYTTRSGDYEANTSGVESTQLAQSVAPPAQKETHWGKMIVAGFFAVASFFDGVFWLGVILALVAAGLFQTGTEASSYNENQWPREYKRWQHSYLCHRCGNYFQLD